MDSRINNLKTLIREKRRMAVAFSGGLDSSVLLACAVDVLGAGECLALTASTPYMMREEMNEASLLAERLGVRRMEIAFPIPEAIRDNPPERCYLCKRHLFSCFKRTAEQEGFSVLADGTNRDDAGDYRPGIRAIRELGVLSPFEEADMGKEEIRFLGRRLGLEESIVSKPAYACLLTRLEHGKRVDEESLRNIDRAESFLRGRGIPGCRVRVHGEAARLEVPDDSWERFHDSSFREEVHKKLTGLGYSFVSLDLKGYKQGSMNRIQP